MIAALRIIGCTALFIAIPVLFVAGSWVGCAASDRCWAAQMAPVHQHQAHSAKY